MFNFPQYDGESIYHYTSGIATLGILKKDKIILQLTHANYLNDTTEGIEIYEHLKKACKNLIARNEITIEQFSKILELEKSYPQEYPVLYMGSNQGNASLAYKSCDVYTMSFCHNSDSLPMWNYYANTNQQGYCLHFNKKCFESYFSRIESFCWARPIVYLEEEKVKHMEELIVDSLSGENYIQAIGDDINLERYFYKHPAFQHEEEYRLLVAMPTKTSKETFEINFKTKNGYIVPYIELEIEDDAMFFLKGITLSPYIGNAGLAENGIKLFLSKNGFNYAANNIYRSKIPVRF